VNRVRGAGERDRAAAAAGLRIGRRGFLKSAVAAATTVAVGCGEEPQGPPSDGWDAGEVLHLLPTANHDRIRLKASFREPLSPAPRLTIGGRVVSGRRTDSAGRFHTFDSADVGPLEPDTQHTLQLHRANGEPLCEAWPLRTFPAPGAEPERFRLLAFTCAGGPDELFDFGFFNAYLPVAHRRRLFARALSFAPDAMVANGDHVYWDMQSKLGWAMGGGPRGWWLAGRFDRDAPIVGSDNEHVLQRAFGPQIADLYGVLFRSIPSYFLQDDHDYGENDEASEALRTFPPDPFMLDLARTTQRLYYPELLADTALPQRYVSPDGVSESFGALRYGKLFEALLYDCRRYMTNAVDPALSHAESSFVPADVERWLVKRSLESPCAHLAQMPSTPILWTAGKWGEWYPDFQDEEGRLRADVAKPYWPEGWSAQHDRLIGAVSSRRDRTPLFVSGDLHALAMGQILESNGTSLAQNPVVSVLSGAIGTGDLGWPSKFRGQLPKASETIRAEETIEPIEENGFSLIDVTPKRLRISFFRWLPEHGEDAIDGLEPFRVVELPRPGRS